MLKRLQEETEQHAAQLHRHARDSYGDADVSPQVNVSMLDARIPDTRPGAEAMTIQEIKEWLIDHGFEADVWELVNRRTPRVKKADWVALMTHRQ